MVRSRIFFLWILIGSLCGLCFAATASQGPADREARGDVQHSCSQVHRLDSLHENWFGATDDCEVSMAYLVRQLDTMGLADREARILELIVKGNTPRFLSHWVSVSVEVKTDDGKAVEATYYVTPDYLAVGCDNDFFRVPLTPQTGQAIADRFNCFLPTKKMVDDIYQAAAVKLSPIPLTEERERVATFYAHHDQIEKQRDGKPGLIAGIKKDVVLSGKVAADSRPNRVAIYGWHLENGEPIQPLYTGHVDRYVDYSHGIRLVYELIKVGENWMHYHDVLADPVLKRLLCDETECDFYAYQ